MRRPEDAKLRAMARETSEEMDLRIAQSQAGERARVNNRLEEMQAALDELTERTAECERLLGIEQHRLHDIAYDGLASGDQGVVWDDFEFDQSVHPTIAKRMIDREGYGHR